MFHARLPLVAAAILSMLALGCPRERPPEPERPAPGADAALICVGAGHACFVDGDGELLCAGRNLDGQLGDGSHVDHTFPVAAGTLRGVARLACGDACDRGDPHYRARRRPAGALAVPELSAIVPSPAERAPVVDRHASVGRSDVHRTRSGDALHPSRGERVLGPCRAQATVFVRAPTVQ